MRLRTLSEADLDGKKVLLRAGFDVPIENGQIQDDRRIKEGLKTVEYLLEKGAQKVTIINHVGRPGGHPKTEFSNTPIIKLVESLVSDPSRVEVKENLRFDSREEANLPGFAQELAAGQDIFVQDAFNTLHQEHTSIVGLPKVLPAYAGLVVENEIKQLTLLVESPEKPFVVIIGGVKIESKMPVIDRIKKLADWVLVGGQVANEIKAQGLYRDDQNVLLPVDEIKDETGVARDIGPETVKLFSQKIAEAKTVFWNGNLGKTDEARFVTGSRDIGKALVESKAKIYIGGGDTGLLIDQLGLASKCDFISTGGGASLKFLAGEQLPGLEALIKSE